VAAPVFNDLHELAPLRCGISWMYVVGKANITILVCANKVLSYGPRNSTYKCPA
jgi:hypothetical protein